MAKAKNPRSKKVYKSLPNNCKPIPNFPTYYATAEGEIWRMYDCKRGFSTESYLRIIKLKDRFNPSNGYHQIQPHKPNGKRVLAYTHRLVLSAFKGLPPKGYECNHIDSNTSNNHISNLEWIPKEKNLSLIKRNPNTGMEYNSKYKDITPKVLQLAKKGKRVNEMVSILNLDEKIIRSILNINNCTIGTKWEKYYPKIKQLKKEGKKPKHIALELGIPVSVVYHTKK